LVLAEQGEFDAGIRIGSEAVRIAETANQPFSQQQAYWGLGSLYLRQGELARSRELLGQALEVTRTWSLGIMHAPIAASLGLARVLAGEVDEGIDQVERTVADIERRWSVFRVHALLALARANLVVDRADDAFVIAERALALARRQRQAGDEAWAVSLLGEISLRGERADPESAARSYDLALTKARALGMRPLEAHCGLGLALVDHAMGDERQASIGIQHAIEAYQKLGMAAPAAAAKQVARTLGLSLGS
jgi:tetratricopeptide (TPR) repeat protein